MRGRLWFTFALAAIALGTSGAFAQDERWDALKKITRRRDYTVLKRGGQCIDGRIAALRAQTLTLKRSTWVNNQPVHERIIIDRAEILRIGESTQPIDVVYCGRNSWVDIQGLLGMKDPEYLLVVMKDRTVKKGSPVMVGDDTLRLIGGADTPKRDIARVYYVRAKPLSSGAQYSAREWAFFDPRLWPYMVGNPPTIPVLLYDSSQREDNTDLTCTEKR